MWVPELQKLNRRSQAGARAGRRKGGRSNSSAGGGHVCGRRVHANSKRALHTRARLCVCRSLRRRNKIRDKALELCGDLELSRAMDHRLRPAMPCTDYQHQHVQLSRSVEISGFLGRARPREVVERQMYIDITMHHRISSSARSSMHQFSVSKDVSKEILLVAGETEGPGRGGTIRNLCRCCELHLLRLAV